MKNRVTRIRYRGKKFLIINIVLLVYLLSLIVGYAFFSESLTINGVASTVDYYDGTNIPAELVVLDTTNNRYSTESQHKDFLDFTSEEWTGDTYAVHYEKRFGIVIGSKTITYSLAFTNPTVLDYTNGSASCSITKNSSGGVKSCSVSVDPTTVEPGQTATVSFVITHNFLTRRNSDSVTATINYELQGKTRTLTFIVYFDES